MKKNVFFIISLLISQLGLGQDITLEGVYRGKDIFVQNPFLNVEGSFCISYIEINGVRAIIEPPSSAVKVDLSKYSIDDPIMINIHHNGGCLPRVLNPEVLNKGAKFGYLQTMADDAAISWVTTGEMPGTGYYFIQMLKLEGWTSIDTVRAKGNLDNNQYSVAVSHYAGDNRFRLEYYYQGRVNPSEEFEFYSDLEPITYYPEKDIYDLISLSRPTDYVIRDHQGNVLLKGLGQDIVVEGLPYGELILIIENREEIIFRPEPEVIVKPRKKSPKRSKSSSN